MMSWWWPPDWFKQDGWVRREEFCVTLPPAPDARHSDIACEYFWMPDKQKAAFLHELGIVFTDKNLTLLRAEPYEDVAKRLEEVEKPGDEKAMTGRQFMLLLKSLLQEGRRWCVIAVLQNIFRDAKKAEYYLEVIRRWPPAQ